MSFLIINASPRKNKNCHQAVEQIKDIFDGNSVDYKILNIWDMNIEYCNACGYCNQNGICHIKDDMKDLYKEFDLSKGTIVVSPVYFDCIPAKLKSLIDRTQAFYASKYILKKPSIDRNKHRMGFFISVGGSKVYKTQFLASQIVVDFFYKSINTKLIDNLYISNTDEVEIKDNEKALEDIKKISIRLIKEVGL
ncbi:NADPH-dependent FMN reductase [Alkalithermobacter thermoalcaliphilus JW-YL-7 = DSM 7308]|uniref:NADPH-dependent FMN reductase n=1 Tax=Alkalithermobacter thermoalcaliphilus JW-YL-7 = DSM 7308 TaxID=1121328 RepID=A0A150FPI2_CLOPD|nr:NADPH-dependent FMN reductase [[Clostridium] paradoxum JW-YL-7 = DSM 7308]SHL25422.1 NADPH-dependent FMN reductase [[Clostridium] paradoxum JW-YL-7 = DSM 7308]